MYLTYNNFKFIIFLETFFRSKISKRFNFFKILFSMGLFFSILRIIKINKIFTILIYFMWVDTANWTNENSRFFFVKNAKWTWFKKWIKSYLYFFSKLIIWQIGKQKRELLYFFNNNFRFYLFPLLSFKINKFFKLKKLLKYLKFSYIKKNSFIQTKSFNDLKLNHKKFNSKADYLKLITKKTKKKLLNLKINKKGNKNLLYFNKIFWKKKFLIRRKNHRITYYKYKILLLLKKIIINKSIIYKNKILNKRVLNKKFLYNNFMISNVNNLVKNIQNFFIQIKFIYNNYFLILPLFIFLKIFFTYIYKKYFFPINNSFITNFFFIIKKKIDLGSETVIYFIIDKLNQRYKLPRIFYLLNQILTREIKYHRIRGYKILCAGRFSRKDRATYIFSQFKTPLTTKLAPISFSWYNIILKYSICILKVWICK